MSELPDPLNEPRGRWENRCAYNWNLDPTAVTGHVRMMVCDRPDGHVGFHRGRLLRLNTSNAMASIIGYVGRSG